MMIWSTAKQRKIAARNNFALARFWTTCCVPHPICHHCFFSSIRRHFSNDVRDARAHERLWLVQTASHLCLWNCCLCLASKVFALISSSSSNNDTLSLRREMNIKIPCNKCAVNFEQIESMIAHNGFQYRWRSKVNSNFSAKIFNSNDASSKLISLHFFPSFSLSYAFIYFSRNNFDKSQQ